MAELNAENKDKGKGGKPKTKKVSTRIDFTPMVDLGFLLITFFMLTTTLIKPQTMEISMPTKDTVPEGLKNTVKESLAITVLLGKNNSVYYFFGAPENGKDPEIIKTNFSSSGIRKMLLDRNYFVVNKIRELKEKHELRQITDEEYKKKSDVEKKFKDAPVVIIKATDDATYNNIVDILDEMQICNIGRYAIVDITSYDLELLKKAGEPVLN
jgi:biopolymer transport protein ExbD